MADTQKPKKSTSGAGTNTRSRVQKVRDRLRHDVGPVARKAGRQIGKALRATAKAAGRTSKVVALRAKVSTRELRIRALFYRIGEAFYRAQKAGKSLEDNAAALYPLLDQVDKLSREIFLLKQQERTIRSSR